MSHLIASQPVESGAAARGPKRAIVTAWSVIGMLASLVMPATLAATTTASAATLRKAAHPSTKPAVHAPTATPSRSPLSSDPAEIRYLSNEAPFVVFDVSPHSIDAPGGSGKPGAVGEAALTFVATDALSYVDIVAYASSPRNGVREVAKRVACGSYIAGYYRCVVPTADALAWLQGEGGLFGMRVEAEGLEGDRSTVQVTLPVKGNTVRLPPAP